MKKLFVVLMMFSFASIVFAQEKRGICYEMTQDGRGRIYCDNVTYKFTVDTSAFKFCEKFRKAIFNPDKPYIVQERKTLTRLAYSNKMIVSVRRDELYYDSKIKHLSHKQYEVESEIKSYALKYLIISFVLMIISSLLYWNKYSCAEDTKESYRAFSSAVLAVVSNILVLYEINPFKIHMNIIALLSLIALLLSSIGLANSSTEPYPGKSFNFVAWLIVSFVLYIVFASLTFF